MLIHITGPAICCVLREHSSCIACRLNTNVQRKVYILLVSFIEDEDEEIGTIIFLHVRVIRRQIA